MERDPRETRNRIENPEAQERITQLRGMLIRELAGRQEGYSDGKSLVVGKPPVTVLGRITP